MAGTDDLRERLTAGFIELASRYNAEGWIEYLLWETLEGKRDRPFRLLDPLRKMEMDLLRSLRDDAQIWIFWQDGQWCHVSIEDWRPYAEITTADVLLEMMPR